MQKFTKFNGDTKLKDSLQRLIENDETAISNNAGVLFPTGLPVGALCYREDCQCLYQLKAVNPDDWALLLNLNDLPVAESNILELNDRLAQQEAATALLTDLAFAQTPATAGIKVDVFTTSGTWTKPAGAKRIKGWLVGAGAGGDSGVVAASTSSAWGGRGGPGGGITEVEIDASTLGSSFAVYVGVGGVGGAPTTITSGNPGKDGGKTYLYIPLVGEIGARGGVGGATYGGSGMFVGGVGGNPSYSNGGSGTSGAGAPGGGTGGGLMGNIAFGYRGGDGGAPIAAMSFARGLGGAQEGGDGLTPSGSLLNVGGGGGGGGSSVASNGGRGGDASNYGAGGGGGGCARSGFTAGAGGNGAPGIAIIITYF